MRHIKIIHKGTLNDKSILEDKGCSECASSCQSACKTSCTVANQGCHQDK